MLKVRNINVFCQWRGGGGGGGYSCSHGNCCDEKPASYVLWWCGKCLSKKLYVYVLGHVICLLGHVICVLGHVMLCCTNVSLLYHVTLTHVHVVVQYCFTPF